MPFPLLVLLLSAIAPLLARGSEAWPGLAPCALCLWQRWPYWVAVGLAALAMATPAHVRVWVLRAAGVAVLGSAAIAGLHVGVEFGWWPSPLPACQAAQVGAGVSVDDLLRSLNPTPSKPCDEPAYLIPGLPLSMAQMNLIYALALAGFVFRGANRDAARRI
jgi:disulfide bond formation protein DsbB